MEIGGKRHAPAGLRPPSPTGEKKLLPRASRDVLEENLFSCPDANIESSSPQDSRYTE